MPAKWGQLWRFRHMRAGLVLEHDWRRNGRLSGAVDGGRFGCMRARARASGIIDR